MKMHPLAARRLLNQQIAATQCTRPEEIVAHLLAMQAQDYLGTLWAIGLRLPSSSERSVEQALDDGSIVRTWPMRGTLHLVAAADVRWMVELLAPRRMRQMASRYRELNIDAATLDRSRDLLREALAGGKQLERGAMFALLEANGIATTGQRGIHILGHLAQEGVLCLGARNGKQFTFALLDEWAPGARSLPHEEALAELARRYFTGHGPATVQDFAWWTGLTLGDARAALAAAAPHLEQVIVDGKTYWQAPLSAESDAGDLADSVFLLPGFDEYLLGYRDRSAVLDPQHAQITHPGGNGMLFPVFYIGGHARGVWKRTLKKKVVELVFSPFEAVTEAQKDAVFLAAERYGQFLGLPVATEWS
jgi:hypothetical protein